MENRKQRQKHLRAENRMGNAEEINFVICKKFWLFLFRENRFREYLLNIYVVPSVVIGFSSVSILTTFYKLVFAILLYGGENTISASDTSSIRQNLFVRTN